MKPCRIGHWDASAASLAKKVWGLVCTRACKPERCACKPERCACGAETGPQRVGEGGFRDVLGSARARKRRQSRATAIVRDRNMGVQAGEMHFSAMHAPVSVSYARV